MIGRRHRAHLQMLHDLPPRIAGRAINRLRRQLFQIDTTFARPVSMAVETVGTKKALRMFCKGIGDRLQLSAKKAPSRERGDTQVGTECSKGGHNQQRGQKKGKCLQPLYSPAISGTRGIIAPV